MKQRVFYIVLVVLLSGGVQTLKAQKVTVKASIDSTHILVGDQLKLLLEVEKPKDLNVVFPLIPDTFNTKIEVVNRTKIDTQKVDDKEREKLTQSLYITSFDSGMYRIPPFYFKLKDGTRLDSAATRELAFQVHGMKIDTAKGPVDIKMPYSAPITLKEVTPYILGIILLAAIIFFILYYIKWKKKNVPLFVKLYLYFSVKTVDVFVCVIGIAIFRNTSSVNIFPSAVNPAAFIISSNIALHLINGQIQPPYNSVLFPVVVFIPPSSDGSNIG